MVTWKAYALSSGVFAVLYWFTGDFFFSGVNGFAVFYWRYVVEEREQANMEVGA